jgi:hypothetical protein
MTDADAKVDAEDLVRVCECVCSGEIEIDHSLRFDLLAWPGGVIAGVGRVPAPALGAALLSAGAVVGGGISASSAPLRLRVGLRGPMGKVRSRRENDDELICPL